MFDKELKRRLVHEILIFLGLMALLFLIIQIWAPLLLMIPVILFVGFLLLVLLKRPEKADTEKPPAAPAALPRPETEKDVLRRAYSVIQRRISEDVEALYPTARWQWVTPNAMVRIETDDPIAIILSGAGGYRKASVRIHNLAYKGLLFETVTEPETLAHSDEGARSLTINSSEDIVSDESSEYESSPSYDYLAFEWVDSRLLDLNGCANEAIGRGQGTLLIPEAELPHKDSWPAICHQLVASDFLEAVPYPDGIHISLKQ